MIRFTVDGSDPGKSAELYRGPIQITQTTSLRARAFAPNGETSGVAVAQFTRFVPAGKLTLLTSYSPQYTGGGDDALIDGRRGRNDWRLGAWQGYEGNDLIGMVDLGRVKEISTVSLGCLQDENSWIFFPVSVEVSTSPDGESFDPPVRIAGPISPREPGSIIHDFSARFNGRQARYVRFEAKNIGVCPDWHKGKGGKAWLFVDEIAIR